MISRISRGDKHGRRLWGSGKGNYSTSGSYGSATVRGTTWLVVDRCDSPTLFNRLARQAPEAGVKVTGVSDWTC